MIDIKALRDIAQSVASDEWMVIDDNDEYQVIVSESLEDGGGYCSYQSVADEVVNRKTADFIAAFNPATVLTLLDELKKDNCSNVHYADAAEMEIAALRQRIDELERSESQLIDERDLAEEALADMYQAATGERPEWSNMFGFTDAVDAVEERLSEMGAQKLTAAATDVLAERQRQQSVEGWTPEHDDIHAGGQLADAAASYALYAHINAADFDIPDVWPWDKQWWKPGSPRRNLVKSGALILAEIERIDRKESAR